MYVHVPLQENYPAFVDAAHGDAMADVAAISAYLSDASECAAGEGGAQGACKAPPHAKC